MASTVIGYYCDIIQGSILFLMFIAVQLVIYGVQVIPEAIVDAFPQSALYAGLAPVSQGDLMLLTVITAYGAIWGLRLIGKSLDGLRELNFSKATSPTI